MASSRMHQLIHPTLLPPSAWSSPKPPPSQPIPHFYRSPLPSHHSRDQTHHAKQSLDEVFTISNSAGCFASTRVRTEGCLKHYLQGRNAWVLFSGWDGALKSLQKICKYFLCFSPEWTLLLCTPGFHRGKPQHSKLKEKVAPSQRCSTNSTLPHQPGVCRRLLNLSKSVGFRWL